MSQDSDGLLVRRVLAGETAAYAGLVERYTGRLTRYAQRMLGQGPDAEEAVQDTFVRAYRSLARCTDGERFGAWIFGILVNRCRTYGSQRARRERVVVHDERAFESASVDPAADRYAWREAIALALDRLAPDLREAFLLKHVEEMSYDEMHDVTGAGISALKMRVKRARDELRRLLVEAD